MLRQAMATRPPPRFCRPATNCKVTWFDSTPGVIVTSIHVQYAACVHTDRQIADFIGTAGSEMSQGPQHTSCRALV